MRVGDLMTRAVVTTTPGAPVDDVAALLAERGVTALPVVAETGSLVGIVTEADLLRGRFPPDPRRKAGRRGDPASGATVGDVMSNPPLTATPATDATQLAGTMIDRGLRSVPVLDGDGVVGIVTRRDLMRTIATDDALIAADVRSRLVAFGGRDRWTAYAQQGLVTITDEHSDPADHDVALVLARTVPGVVHVEIVPASGPGLG